MHETVTGEDIFHDNLSRQY